MRTQSADTHPEAERILIAGIRSFSPLQRFARIRSITTTMMYANMYSSNDARSDNERAIAFVSEHYGQQFANSFQRAIAQQDDWTLQPFDIQAILRKMIAVLEEVHLAPLLSGSIACGLYGFPRGVHTIDLAVQMRPEHICHVHSLVDTEFLHNSEWHYNQSQQNRLQFLHLRTLVKVDVQVFRHNVSVRGFVQRGQPLQLTYDMPPIQTLAAEDILLACLSKYHLTAPQADDQWNDILGILKIQGPHLDLDYVWQQARQRRLAMLLRRALSDADFGGKYVVPKQSSRYHSSVDASH